MQTELATGFEIKSVFVVFLSRRHSATPSGFEFADLREGLVDPRRPQVCMGRCSSSMVGEGVYPSVGFYFERQEEEGAERGVRNPPPLGEGIPVPYPLFHSSLFQPSLGSQQNRGGTQRGRPLQQQPPTPPLREDNTQSLELPIVTPGAHR